MSWPPAWKPSIHQRVEVGAGGIQRGRVPGRAASDDDDLVYVVHAFLRETGRARRKAATQVPPARTLPFVSVFPTESLAADSPLSRAWPGFRERAAQRTMADAVAETFEHGGALVCEAGTGVGKSLAYLIPAASAGRTVVISTATRALQSQLLHDDLPLAEAALGRKHRRRRPEGPWELRLQARGGATSSSGSSTSIIRPRSSGCGRGSRAPMTGDRAELDFAPPAGLWGELSVGPERCRGARCPLQSTCFSERARARAGEAEIVFVNHALYFADLGLRLASDGRDRRPARARRGRLRRGARARGRRGGVARRAHRRLRSRAAVARDRACLRARRDDTSERGSRRHGAPRRGAGSRARLLRSRAVACDRPMSRRCPRGATSGLRDALSTLAARLEGGG